MADCCHDDGCACCHHEEEEENHVFLVIRLIIGAIALGTLLLLVHVFNVEIANYILIPAYGVTFLFLGYDVIIRAVKNIIGGEIFDENFLMCVASIAAFCVGSYEEAVGVMLFYQLGEFVQDLAVDKSRKSISSLMDIRPDIAFVIRGEEVISVDPAKVQIGEIILVKPGEKIPLDGTLIEGTSSLDTRALTGESLPRDVAMGDIVLSGSTNITGVIKIRVTKSFGESTASKILDLVQNASENKAPSENFITKFARYYTPIVCGLALLVALIPPIFMGDWATWIRRGCTFLVISCPCALVLSIPLTFFSGIGAASHSGILIKGSNYLEALNDVKTIVLDKTGTLTCGRFSVTGIYPADGKGSDALLQYAAHAESYSNHPIALSIMEEYKGDVDKAKLNDYKELSGYGISVSYEGKELLCGNAKLMSEHEIAFTEPEEIGSKVHVSLAADYLGCIIVSDTLKKDTVDGIDELASLGIKTVMLTGDEEAIAASVAEDAHITEYHAELLPGDKVDLLEKIIGKGGRDKVAFVGDGINDAPVLARSDVGFAMGGIGSDAAIEAADIVLMTDEISKISKAIKIAKKTKKIVKENIVFALTIKFIFLICTAFGIGIFANFAMWLAVFADVGVCLLAILNAMRMLLD